MGDGKDRSLWVPAAGTHHSPSQAYLYDMAFSFLFHWSGSCGYAGRGCGAKPAFLAEDAGRWPLLREG